MKSFAIKITLLILLVVSVVKLADGWGFWAHKRINHMAVFTLPPAMFGFYKAHIDFLTEHAVDPDRRRYSDPKEAPRHYIDLDHFGVNPLDSMPKYWKQAVEKYTEDTLNAYGIVPWHINLMMYRLTDAFRSGDVDKIIYFSANLGHYIADAHVPLHTSENYNGQFTNQVGIHGFWESRVPEMFGDDYDYLVGRAVFVSNVQMTTWKFVEGSFNALDSVLTFERELNKQFDTDRKYAYEQRGGMTSKMYSSEYTRAYSDTLNGMVERRIREAIRNVGSFWYTAWVNAGSPDLNYPGQEAVSDDMKKQLEEEELQMQNGTVKPPPGHDDNEVKSPQ